MPESPSRSLNVPEKYAKLGVVVAAFAGPTWEPRQEVALIRRKKEPFAGAWALPGGGVEHGERVSAAAARELREETGIETLGFPEVKGHREFIEGKWHRYHVLTETWTLASPLRAGDDASDARWWKVKDALASPEVTDYAKACLRDILEAAK